MNGFDVQAIGWLVTRDMCCQATRCITAFAQTVASFLVSLFLGQYFSPDNPTVGQAGLAFFVVGFWYLATTVQLFRTYRLIRVLSDTLLPAYKKHGTSRRDPTAF